MPVIARALLSVSDKRGIIEFARVLVELRVTVLSTGGTGRLLASHGLPVIDVSEYTGFPEIMSGRLKTLHPKIHGGLLGRRDTDAGVMAEHGIESIDLLVVNLYPFEDTVADPKCDLATAIENIDIGGPTMLRAAAKNHAAVTVVVDADDYDRVLDEMRANHSAVSDATRFDLAVKAFEHTARYDGVIANYLGAVEGDRTRSDFPRTLNVQYAKVQDMRYGENPHQAASLYREAGFETPSVASACLVQGKPLSYNNVADADAALECAKTFDTGSACVIVKHANPCGVAIGNTPLEAYERAFRTDPTSAFGGIIAFNEVLDSTTAEAILERQFVEVIIAPEIDEGARSVLSAKPNVRVLATGRWEEEPTKALDFKRVTGGMLVQEQDQGRVSEAQLRIVSKRRPSENELSDLLFAWKVVKYVKSNAIVYCRDRATIGIGAGQMSRVYSARIAAIKAADEGLDVEGSVMASDAFFPFRDSIDSAAEVGIAAVIQPGGSVRDDEVIAAADEHDIAMVFTGLRHFRH